MSNFRIATAAPSPATAAPTVSVENRRTRRTARVEEPSFGSVMKAGGNALLRGVETAAGVVGGPLLSGAVSAAAGASGGPRAPGGGGAAGGDNDVFDRARQLQEQAQFFNMQYLELQQQTQQDARRFTTLSNLAKAEHDNAKNILRNVSS